MPFRKGRSGNPGGKAKGRPWRDAIERALERRHGKADLKGIDDLADTLINAAACGDITAMKEIGDRLEGKPAQVLEHSGNVTLTHEEMLAQLGEDDPA